MICSAESPLENAQNLRCARSPTSKMSGRLARLRVEAGSIGPSPSEKDLEELLGLASIGLLIHRRREFIGAPTLHATARCDNARRGMAPNVFQPVAPPLRHRLASTRPTPQRWELAPNSSCRA